MRFMINLVFFLSTIVETKVRERERMKNFKLHVYVFLFSCFCFHVYKISDVS